MSDNDNNSDTRELHLDFKVINVNVPKIILDSYLYDELVNFSSCNCSYQTRYDIDKLRKIYNNFDHFLGYSCSDIKNQSVAKLRTNKYFYWCKYDQVQGCFGDHRNLITYSEPCNLGTITHLIVSNFTDNNIDTSKKRYLNLSEFTTLEFLQLPYEFDINNITLIPSLKHLVLGINCIDAITIMVRKQIIQQLETISFICYFRDYDNYRPERNDLENTLKYYCSELQIQYFD
jgi:hypothetical protein